mgnify:CR=1 FL=1
MFTPAKLPARPEDLHARVYGGTIFHLEGCRAVAELIEHTQKFLEEAFHPRSPQLVHEHYTPDQQAELCAELQRQFGRSGDVRRRWRAVFEAAGLEPAAMACDDLYLRFQPHRDRSEAAPRAFSTATLGFHRDTWGTNVYAQTNWWAPVYPITAGRTFAYFPDLWDTPLQNTTEDFDFRAIVERSIRGEEVDAEQGMPHLLEEVDSALARPVVIDPGSMVVFSGAHAHAGVPNNTGLTRISLETRSVWIEDFRRGLGAPNVDGRAPWMSLGLFRRFSDGVPLHEIFGLNSFEAYEQNGVK